jgi:hypothetical protein
MIRKYLPLAGKTKEYQKQRAYTTFNELVKIYKRHKSKFVEGCTGLHYGDEDDECWAFSIATSLFDEGRIDSVYDYQDRLLKQIDHWRETRIFKIYQEALSLRNKIITMINSGKTAIMTEDELQQLIHNYNGLVEEIPYIPAKRKKWTADK